MKDCRNCRNRYCYYNLKVLNKLINTFVNLWQSFQTSEVLPSPTIRLIKHTVQSMQKPPIPGLSVLSKGAFQCYGGSATNKLARGFDSFAAKWSLIALSSHSQSLVGLNWCHCLCASMVQGNEVHPQELELKSLQFALTAQRQAFRVRQASAEGQRECALRLTPAEQFEGWLDFFTFIPKTLTILFYLY